MIASSRLSPQTHSLWGGLGYVHIGQVGRSELSAYIVHVLIRKKLTRKCNKCDIMMFRCQTLSLRAILTYLWYYILSAIATVFVTDIILAWNLDRSDYNMSCFMLLCKHTVTHPCMCGHLKASLLEICVIYLFRHWRTILTLFGHIKYGIHFLSMRDFMTFQILEVYLYIGDH